MAAGSARIVRYIVFAFVFLSVLYFVSHSSYRGVQLKPDSFGVGKGPSSSTSTQSERPAEKPVDKVESDVTERPSSPDGKLDVPPGSDRGSSDGIGGNTESGAGNSGSGAGDSGSPKSTTGSPIGFMDGINESPMALGPSDKGWNDLFGPAPGPRMNATFVTLARNSDVWDIARSIRQVEDRFNRRYNYDWVFLNDKPFDDAFKKVTTSLVSGKTFYGEIPHEHWSFPEWIDQDKAKKVREDMAQRKIIYGDSISYRHMCRFESGFFFRQELMLNYEWYWRVEPSIELFCDVHYDPFRFMAENKKKYSFVLSLFEYKDTIPTLWDSVKKFIKNYPEHVAKDNSMGFLSDDGGDNYNLCHFWSNFEVGNLNWLRSKQYIDFFDSLDKDGGFFYERWGDAPVHSIAAGLLLQKDEIQFFNDIAYFHVPFTHCPTGEQTRVDLRCHCNPKDNFDWQGYSCTAKYFEFNGLEKPKGWEDDGK